MGREIPRSQGIWTPAERVETGDEKKHHGRGTLRCLHLANLLTDSWRLGKVSWPSRFSPESTLRRNTSSLHLRGGPFPTRELLSFLQPGSDHGVQGGQCWLGSSLRCSQSPPGSQQGSHVHCRGDRGGGRGEHHSCPNRTHSFWNLSGNADLPRPRLLAWKTGPETPTHYLGPLPACVAGTAFTTPALWRLQENERREGGREGEKKTFVQECTNTWYLEISRSRVKKKGEQEGGERASENERKMAKQARERESESPRGGGAG